MVRRPSDEPRGVADSIAATRARDDELARAQGRGSTALRDSSGNVIVMNADSPYPLLRPMGVDGSMAFAPDGTVKVISPDTLEDRDLTTRDVASSGRVDGQFVGGQQMGTNELGVGTVNSARMTAGPVNIDGNGILTPGIGVGGRGDFGRITCGPVNIDPNGVQTPGVNAGGTVGCQDLACRHFIDDGLGNVRNGKVWPSRAALKIDVRDFAEKLDGASYTDVVNALNLSSYRYREGLEMPEGEQSGIILEDLERIAPSLIVRGEAAAGIGSHDHYSGWEMTLCAIGALQEKDRQIALLSDKVDYLSKRLDGLEDSRDQ